MKCIIEDSSIDCRRCLRSGLPCIFVPRANAATVPDVVLGLQEGDFKADVLRRLKVIEDTLGLADEAPKMSTESVVVDDVESDEGEDLYSAGLGALWDAAVVLQSSAPSSVPQSIWRKSTVKDLWLS
jgi:hypothetical protein